MPILRTLPAAALLLFAGASLRAADQRDYFCGEISRPYFKEGPAGFFSPARTGSKAAGFGLAKPRGELRVFVLGESAAGLLGPEPGETGGAGIVNCGMAAYDSYRIDGVLRETLLYQPDLLVLLSGNNEGNEDGCPGPAAAWRRFKKKAAVKFRSLLPPKDGLPPAVSASLAAHEGRVRGMARRARRAGVPLLICSLPANALMPPEGPAPTGSADFYRGEAALLRGDGAAAGAAAGAAFAAWLAAAPADPLRHYYSGLAAKAAGKTAEAAAFFDRAISLAPGQERASRERNAMLAGVAREEGACFADLAAAFSAAAPGRIAGFGQFTDGVHWRAGQNAAAWAAILSAARGCGLKVPDFRPAPPAHKERTELPLKRLSYAAAWLGGPGLRERSVAMIEQALREDPAAVARAAGSAPELDRTFIRNFWSAGRAGAIRDLYPVFALNAAEAYRRAGRGREALALADKAAALGVKDPALHLLRARLLAAAGKKKEAAAALFSLYGEAVPAAAALGEALGLPAPRPCRSPGGEAVAVSRALSDEGLRRLDSGRFAAAGESFAAAARTDPGNAGALATLCMLAKRAGRLEEAAARCALAAETALGACGPAEPERFRTAAAALAEGGLINLELGRKAEAAAAFRLALETAPAGWERRREISRLLEAAGNR